MPKLTAQRARERIEHLKRWKDQRGLTLREEEYLEALEIAAEVITLRKAMTEPPEFDSQNLPHEYEGARYAKD